MLRTTVDRRNMHVTVVTRYDDNAHVTAAVRMLLNQADSRSQAKVTRLAYCSNGESHKVQAWCTRHLAAGVLHSFPTPPAVGPPTSLTDTRALSNSRLATVYLWLSIAKAVSHCPGRLKLFDAAKTRGAHTHTSWWHQAASVVWASPGVERCDKLTDFTLALYTHANPGVCVSLHQCLPRSAVRRSA